MLVTQPNETSNRYARCIQASKRIRWDIDTDVIRGRTLDVAQKFLPDGLSLGGAFFGTRAASPTSPTSAQVIGSSKKAA